MACINRTTNKLNDGMYHIHFTSNPINYKKDDGSYEPIDLSFNDSTSTIGDISLNRKNVFSTGIRKDKNPDKFLGIRPDNCQDGSKQIEFSISKVKLDGAEDYDISNFSVEINNGSLKKMYKNSGFKDFEIEYKIDLKGVSIVNQKYTENSKIRNSLKTEFINLGQDTGANILNRYANDPSIAESESYLRIYNGQITDDFFASFGYTKEDEFGDADVSNYSFYDMSGQGSSIYLKDNLVFYAVGKDIDGFVDSILLNLCNKYDLSLEGNEADTGKYFFKDGKKIGGYAWVDENKVLAYFNTKEIPEDIKSLYLNKDFNETSFINLSQSQFNTDIETQFNYDVSSIEVGTDYYQGDRFEILINNNAYFIDKPVIFNSDKVAISNYEDTEHTLKDNGDGTYTYTKYLSIEGILNNLGATNNFIDVNVQTTLAPHIPRYQFSNQTGTLTGWNNVFNATNWNTARNASTGNGTTLWLSGAGIINIIYYDKRRRQKGSISSNNQWFMGNNAHFHFDTSSISSASAVKFKHYSYYLKGLSGEGQVGDNDEVRYIYLKSVKSDNSTTNHQGSWNDFDGFTTSWDSDDVTEYSGTITISSTSQAWVEDDLNSDAISDVESLDDFKIAFVEHYEYYSNSLDTDFHPAIDGTIGGNTNNDANKSVITGGEIGVLAPYLEVTVPTTTPTNNATFFGANF